MIVTFQTDDKMEINQLTKAGDMALALWKITQIQFNIPSGYFAPAQLRAVKYIANEITNILEEQGINLNGLTE